jgi:ABC-type transport system involved in cytochrome c biogenesis permease subunit
MTSTALAELSRTLYSPVTLLLLTGGMVAYLYAMAFSRVGAGADGADREAKGRRARRLGTVLTAVGTATLVTHMVTRSLAADRAPLGNMFEFSTVMALTVLLGGLLVVQWRLRRPDLMGFLVLGAVLTMGAALLVYDDPGPLMPILDSWWRAIHVSAIVFAAGIFTVAFVFTGLYLIRDTAERRLAALGARATGGGSTVGAAAASDLDGSRASTAVLDDPEDVVVDRTAPDVDGDHPDPAEVARHRADMRATINPWWLAAGVWLGAAAVSWVFWVDSGSPSRFLMVNTVLALAAVLARWFVPYLPDAATLDGLAYRTIAFGFPVWTFAVIAGAIWAEQSWGRYWGWDPKETSAFLTWVAYAGYLHARATRGMRGRKAGWLGLLAFVVLMFTYFAVNLVVVGLHSYA